MTSQDSGVPKKVEVRNGRPTWIGSNTKPYFLNVLFFGYLILGGTNLRLCAYGYGFQMEQTWRWCGFRAVLNRDCVDIFVCLFSAGKLTWRSLKSIFKTKRSGDGFGVCDSWHLWGLNIAPPPQISHSHSVQYRILWPNLWIATKTKCWSPF